MAPRIKTRERIVQNSLELFNQLGERSVSTNHIAAHMEISPGNLYYHFPNKQAIIALLFSQYEELVDSFLRPPQGRAGVVHAPRIDEQGGISQPFAGPAYQIDINRFGGAHWFPTEFHGGVAFRNPAAGDIGCFPAIAAEQDRGITTEPRMVFTTQKAVDRLTEGLAF